MHSDIHQTCELQCYVYCSYLCNDVIVAFSYFKPLECNEEKCLLAISNVGLLIATHCVKSLVYVDCLHRVGSCILSHSKIKTGKYDTVVLQYLYYLGLL